MNDSKFIMGWGAAGLAAWFTFQKTRSKILALAVGVGVAMLMGVFGKPAVVPPPNLTNP